MWWIAFCALRPVNRRWQIKMSRSKVIVFTQQDCPPCNWVKSFLAQRGVEFEEYYRCYAVGQEKVHIMKYDPKAPHHERYVKGNPPPSSQALRNRMEKDALALCRALGYDLNTVEFAVENGVPYAIDFLNPAPDAEVTSVGQENFDWIVNAVAEMAVKMAQSGTNPVKELSWAEFLAGT